VPFTQNTLVLHANLLLRRELVNRTHSKLKVSHVRT
jgi:hypothetical protein